MPKATTKYERLHQERRKQILLTAKRLILEKNITAVTMSDIAAACGVSRQTLYKYFNSFEAVVYGVQGDIIESMPRPQGTTMTQYVCSSADTLFRYYQENHDDFLFICIFDVYIRTHKTENEMNRHYRQVVGRQLPDLKTLVNDVAPVDGRPVKEVFTVAIHMIWGIVTRMAVLGDHFCEIGGVTQEQSLQIAKEMVVSYLRQSGRAGEEPAAQA